MIEKLQDELKTEPLSPMHRDLLKSVIEFADSSRSTMQQHYSTWDSNQSIYNAVISLDDDDKQALKDGKPPKQKVPLIYAKVDAFRAHMNSLFSQRKRFYELTPVEDADTVSVENIETLLEKDTVANSWPLRTRQVSTDVARFGLSVIYDEWEELKVFVPVTKTRKLLGVSLGESTTFQEVIKHQGNKVRIISPYSFLPDTRIPFSNLQEGDYCGCEYELTLTALYDLEAQEIVQGVEHIQDFTSKRWTHRRKNSARSATIRYDKSASDYSDVVVITDFYMKLIPSRYTFQDDTKLGTETHSALYRVWVANDSRIIRFELVGNYHQQFPFSVAQFDPDDQECVGQSLVERIEKLQELSDWMINARIAAVKRSVDSKLVVDPAGIDVASLQEGGQIILTKRGAGQRGLKNLIQQFDVQDTTQNHLTDSQVVGDLTNSVSGITENAQGNYSRGRRSATEARAVNSGGHSRMNSLAECLWLAWAQTGNRMVANLRQGVSQQYFAAVTGLAEDKLAEAFAKFEGTPENVIQSNDYFMYDGMLPSDKLYLAQSLQEILALVLGNPETQLTFDISPNLLMNYIMELRGVKGLKQVALTKDPQQLMRLVQQIVQQALAEQQEQFQEVLDSQPPPAAEPSSTSTST